MGKVSNEECCKNYDWLIVKCSCFHSQRGIMWAAPRAYFNTLTHSPYSLTPTAAPHPHPISLPCPIFWSPTVSLWRHTYIWQLNTAAEIGFMEWAKMRWDFKRLLFRAGSATLSSSSSVIFACLMMFNNRVRHGRTEQNTLPTIVPPSAWWWLEVNVMTQRSISIHRPYSLQPS